MPTVSKNTNMEKKIDNLTSMVETLASDMKDVKRVLKGDEYGAKGLVESHKDLKKDFLVVKDDVKKGKVIGSVVAAILGSLMAIFRGN